MPAVGLWRMHQSMHRAKLNLPADSELRRVLNDLETNGVAITHLDDLARAGVPLPHYLIERTLSSLTRAVDETDRGSKNYVSIGDTEYLSRDQKLFSLGIEPTILDVVEFYIGSPVSYKGVQSRCNKADGTKVETRLWHRDAEDRRIIKIIVYCDDVGPDDGPFCYVPKGKVPEHKLIYVGNRIADETMDSLVGKENQISSVGRKGTVVFADTCTVFHRGDVPRGERHRRTLWYIYNSLNPLRPEYCSPLYASEWVQPHLPTLTLRQRATLIA
jgi:hypothetical protein